MEEFNTLKDTYLPILIDYGLNVVWAIVILIIGWAASRWFGKKVEKSIHKKKRISSTLDPFLVTFTRLTVIAITLLMVLNQFGIETASVIALLGTIGLAIGLALQGSLSNVASGIMILALRPFKVGDAVNVNGRDAVVDEIGLFVTELHTFDNIALIITNTKVWQDVIENHTLNSTRRVDLVFGVDYNEDIDRVFRVVKDVLDHDERVLSEPEPLIAVGELSASWINIYVRPWTKTDVQFQLGLDLQKRIKERFDKEGITMPYPIQELRLPESSQEKTKTGDLPK